jgi:hypothetical protein
MEREGGKEVQRETRMVAPSATSGLRRGEFPGHEHLAALRAAQGENARSS